MKMRNFINFYYARNQKQSQLLKQFLRSSLQFTSCVISNQPFFKFEELQLIKYLLKGMNNNEPSGYTSSFQLDDFTIKDQIGVGKFGAVCKAVEKNSQQTVAIKIIPKRTITSQILFTQLKRQIEIQSRLKHPSICQLYACFHDQNNIFIVLEYCAKGSLAYLIKDKREVLSEQQIALIFQQLVEAVAYMHTRHVMHRDLKLQNILLADQQRVKISDFGWCVHHPSQRNTFCGTMEYISPEMLNRESYEHSIDMYCLGIILYELFYFVSPFLGQDQAQTIEKIKQGRLHFDDQLRSIPQDAKILIRRLLDRDPLKRPKAKDLFNDQFITKNSSSKNDKKKARRRITQETFNQFKEQINKLALQQCTQTHNTQQPEPLIQITEQNKQVEFPQSKNQMIKIETQKLGYQKSGKLQLCLNNDLLKTQSRSSQLPPSQSLKKINQQPLNEAGETKHENSYQPLTLPCNNKLQPANSEATIQMGHHNNQQQPIPQSEQESNEVAK